MLYLEEEKTSPANIKVVGIGGGGMQKQADAGRCREDATGVSRARRGVPVEFATEQHQFQLVPGLGRCAGDVRDRRPEPACVALNHANPYN